MDACAVLHEVSRSCYLVCGTICGVWTRPALTMAKVLPTVEYTITRSFACSWFTPLTYFFGVIFLVALVMINIVIEGYETVTVFDADFNFRLRHWYDKWLPVQLSDAPCDSVVFNPGDSFTTNYSLFSWNFQSKANTTAGDAGIPYQGSTLDKCDLRSIVLDMNMQEIELDVDAIMTCENDTAFNPIVQTSYAFKHLGIVANNELLHPNNTLPGFINILVQAAAKDTNDRIADYKRATRNSPTSISLRIDFSPCPSVRGPNADCARNPPNLEIVNSALGFSNGTITVQGSLDQAIIPQAFESLFVNIAQVIYAMVHIDLGNASPNNFFVNPDVLNETIFSTFPAVSPVPALNSLLYDVLADPEQIDAGDLLPLHIGGPAHLRVAYACRVQQRKPIGRAVVAVIVATLSMFSAGWGIYILGATLIAKRRPGANECGRHLDLEASLAPKENFT